MSIDLRELDLADEQQLRAFHEVTRRAEKEDGRDWTRVWTYDEMVSTFCDPDETERAEACAAYVDGRMVGAGVLYVFLLQDLQKTWLEVYVDPAERRRGVGSALVDWGVERTRSEGRTQVASESTYAFELRESAPAFQFAQKHGFRVANTEICRRLEIPPPDGRLEEIEAEAAAHAEGFTFQSFVGRVPDELIESYCALNNKLAIEAPGGEYDWEEESVTPAIHREMERKLAGIGRIRWTTGAVHDGKVVALTDLMVTKGEDRASQWSTIVDRDFRGHRLGAAVKVANLRQVLAAHPELTAVQTTNAETNANMVDINERLGFKPIALCPGFLRDL